MDMRRGVVVILLLLMVVGCTPAANDAAQPLPTLQASPTPPQLGIDGAQRTAVTFLDAWTRGDFDAMYSLISVASQGATSLDRFREIYQGAQTEMTLQSLSYTPNTIYRESPQVVVFNYNITVDSNILGEFSDDNRDMRLVIDSRSSEWRVAWTAGDIFLEMGNGALLHFVPIVPRRANIYDRNGVLLADQNGRIVTVNITKNQIPVYETCVQTLATALDKSAADVHAELDPIAGNWLYQIGKLEPAVFERNQDQLTRDCNAQFDTLYTRRYLRGTLAPHVIGYVGYLDENQLPAALAEGFDSEAILGKTGIEASWDETLRGRPGGRLELLAPSGERLRVIAEAASKPSESVWLTIDADLQQYVMQVIGEAYASAADSWAPGSKGAAAVVMDVHTGEILAMVSWPSFEANALTPYPAIGRDVANIVIQNLQNNPSTPQLNRATMGRYPAGSIFKTVDSIAVTDSGIYSLDHTYNCTPSWSREPGGFTRYDWNPNGQGILTVAGALTRSCNTFFYEVGYEMDGVDPFILPSYARRLGLGETTGLRDLPESPGQIPDPDWLSQFSHNTLSWSVSNSVDMAIGQGYVEVTPLQIARLFSMIANGGTFYRPQLVSRTGLADNFDYTMQPDPMDQITLHDGVLDLVRSGLCDVTSTHAGTAWAVFRDSPLEDIGVCGKTGTAQNGGPNDGKLPHAWFAAYAPRENPEIAVAVVIENGGEGSAVAAPIVRRILEHYFYGTS